MLAVVAHDLRSPLAALRWTPRCCAPAGAEPRRGRRAPLARMYDTTRRMDGLIEDLLDVSRVDRGALALELQVEHDVGALLARPPTCCARSSEARGWR
jgi:signal transduction histidine kinase